VRDQREETGDRRVDWPAGLPPLASTEPLAGGDICSTTLDTYGW
jgi:hypothetical protein